VQAAAIDALGSIADEKDFEGLFDRAFAANGQAAQKALKSLSLRMNDREATAAKVAARMQNASADDQCFVLNLLGDLGGKEALNAVVHAVKTTDPAVKNDATRVLGAWATADAMPALLEIAKHDADQKYRIRALRGYIRLARHSAMSESERLKAFDAAMAAAVRDKEKQIALDIPANSPSVKSLQTLVPYLKESAIKNAAAEAAVKIAEKIVAQQPQAVHAAMQEVLAAGATDKSAEKAAQLLHQTQSAAKSSALLPEDASFKPIFDGKTFSGWEGDKKYFRIEDGAIVGGNLNTGLKKNQFLCTEKSYGDFDLRFQCKLVGAACNGGMQIRSKRVPNGNEVAGYQADMAKNYWGCLYDEARRNKILAGKPPKEQAKFVKADEWNDYAIRCEGRRIQIWVNGVQTVDYTEPDAKIPQTGILGVQIHAGKPSETWYKNIRIKELSK